MIYLGRATLVVASIALIVAGVLAGLAFGSGMGIRDVALGGTDALSGGTVVLGIIGGIVDTVISGVAFGLAAAVYAVQADLKVIAAVAREIRDLVRQASIAEGRSRQ